MLVCIFIVKTDVNKYRLQNLLCFSSEPEVQVFNSRCAREQEKQKICVFGCHKCLCVINCHLVTDDGLYDRKGFYTVKIVFYSSSISELRLSSIWKMANLLVEQIIENCRITETEVIEMLRYLSLVPVILTRFIEYRFGELVRNVNINIHFNINSSP